MFKSQYLNEVFNNLSLRNAHEKEFLQAVEEFLESIDLIIDQYPNIQKHGIIERIVEPERMISFRVPWVDDNGKVQVNRGYRCQFNSAIGPYKGGCRFHPSVNQSIIKFLGFEQMFKNSLTTLPMGGGKGGADFNPTGRSDNEIMRFCHSFMAELYRHIGSDIDVPAGDIGVGAREVGFLYGYYRKLKNEWTETFTGKGLTYGGSLARKEATGYGLCYFVEEMLKVMKNDSFKGKKVVISGAGNVATYAAYKCSELGGKVIAMNDSKGYIYDEAGIDIDFVKEIKEGKRLSLDQYLTKYPKAKYGDVRTDIWKIKCDIALPCATQNELDLESAQALVANKVMVVAEGANMPTTLEATKYLQENKVLFAPGKAANAGGVATSGLEMTQNAMRLSWSFEEVDEKLKGIMINIFENTYKASEKCGQKGNLVLGANIAGFLKICDAMIAQGVI
ncbi:MAG: NADP-specific glutamate dehydrogenase [Bacilli bacterium]|jgi:glutamate dehydrogenase (NADP+)